MVDYSDEVEPRSCWINAGVMTVAPVGAVTASLLWVTVALRLTVASPEPLLPSGAVIEIDPAVATEPLLLSVNVYVPGTAPIEVPADGSTLSIVGRTAF